MVESATHGSCDTPSVATASLPDRRHDGPLLARALVGAVVLHGLLLGFVVLPDAPEPPPRPIRPVTGPEVWEYEIPLPEREAVPAPRDHPAERLPMPEVDAAEVDLGPVDEPFELPVAPSLEGEFEVMLGAPIPPPAGNAGPRIPGVDGVTAPIKLDEYAVRPEYPELARISRVGSRVVLEAVIGVDGTVRDIVVLQSLRPHLGFEAAAIEAVRQWRYEPATQRGQPVEVYFTVVVEFSLD